MGKIQKKNWVIDAILFVGYLVSMCLDLTGLQIHEWLGLAVIVLAGYHLFIHRRWVFAISEQIFKRVNGQARNWYVVDLAMMIGFVVILVTGLLDSSWLHLNLPNYLMWRDLHIYASLVTIALLVLKMALHWRWIATATARIFTPTPQASQTVCLESSASLPGIGRREFIGIMGTVSVTALLASSTAISTIIEANASYTGADATLPTPGATKSSSTTATTTSTSSSTTTKTQTTTANATQPIPPTTTTSTTTTTPTTTTNAQAASTSIGTCKVACNKRCSYPGRCKRYVDTNGNKRCDLGECAV
jgi:hypothetical protein